MKFKTLSQRRIEKRFWLKENPHYWFAWFPVVTDDGYWVWLEYIERQMKRGANWMDSSFSRWFYQLPKSKRR